MPGGGGKPEVVREPVQQTQTSTTTPWAAQQPFLETGFERAESEILNQPLQFFPGQTYVDYSPETEQALAQAVKLKLYEHLLQRRFVIAAPRQAIELKLVWNV